MVSRVNIRAPLEMLMDFLGVLFLPRVFQVKA